MKASISRKIILYITAIMAGSAIFSYIIFHNIFKETYKSHFIGEMEKSELVLTNYLESRYTLLESGLDILLSDPRFLASIAENDPRTAQLEIADFKELVQADFLIVGDTSANILAKTGIIDFENWHELNFKVSKYQRGDEHFFTTYGDSIYQVISAPIYFFNRFPIGKLTAGYLIDQKLIKKFQQLSGAEIILYGNNKVIEQTSSSLQFSDEDIKSIIASAEQRARQTGSFEHQEEYLVLSYTFEGGSDVNLLLIQSLDKLLNPVMNRITLYLIVFNALVLLISILLIFRFTSKNLTGAVNALVRSASKISRNEFDEPVKPRNNDELGFLAESFDKMRLTLKDNLKKLAEAQDERVRSERLATIGQIAAGIIHDFKSPMTVITMSAEIIASNMKDESQKKYTQNIQSQVNRMVNMAQDILDYSHGKKSLNLSNVEFTKSIINKVEFQRKRFEDKKIELKTITPPPFNVSIDTNKFTRVLDNILNNAHEALSPGDKVEICVKRSDDNFQLLISDNGPGIPEEIIDTLFQPFVTSGKAKGTGLGLAISSKIIEDHGGKISVKSEKNKGTIFTITLPNTLLNLHKPGKKVGQIHEN